jgi:hypothetical protein
MDAEKNTHFIVYRRPSWPDPPKKSSAIKSFICNAAEILLSVAVAFFIFGGMGFLFIWASRLP